MKERQQMPSLFGGGHYQSLFGKLSPAWSQAGTAPVVMDREIDAYMRRGSDLTWREQDFPEPEKGKKRGQSLGKWFYK